MRDLVERYEGKPLLRFIDVFVLDTMDILDEETQTNYSAIADTLPGIFGTPEGLTWQETISEVMGYTSDLSWTS